MQVTDSDVRLFRVLCTSRSILPRKTITYYAKNVEPAAMWESSLESGRQAMALDYADREIKLNTARLKDALQDGSVTIEAITNSANFYGFKLQ